MAAYLLDTHALLWWLADDPSLPKRSRELIADGSNEIHVSAATGWEISIKRALGKLKAPNKLASVVEEEGFQSLPIQFEHAERAGALPKLHRDPFDRMLVAQCELERLVLVTGDPNIRRYRVRTAWE